MNNAWGWLVLRTTTYAVIFHSSFSLHVYAAAHFRIIPNLVWNASADACICRKLLLNRCYSTIHYKFQRLHHANTSNIIFIGHHIDAASICHTKKKCTYIHNTFNVQFNVHNLLLHSLTKNCWNVCVRIHVNMCVCVCVLSVLWLPFVQLNRIAYICVVVKRLWRLSVNWMETRNRQ